MDKPSPAAPHSTKTNVISPVAIIAQERRMARETKQTLILTERHFDNTAFDNQYLD